MNSSSSAASFLSGLFALRRNSTLARVGSPAVERPRGFDFLGERAQGNVALLPSFPVNSTSLVEASLAADPPLKTSKKGPFEQVLSFALAPALETAMTPTAILIRHQHAGIRSIIYTR